MLQLCRRVFVDTRDTRELIGTYACVHAGKLYYPLGDQGRMPHVATADIGSVAADCLINPVEHAGATLNVVAEYGTHAHACSHGSTP